MQLLDALGVKPAEQSSASRSAGRVDHTSFVRPDPIFGMASTSDDVLQVGGGGIRFAGESNRVGGGYAISDDSDDDVAVPTLKETSFRGGARQDSGSPIPASFPSYNSHVERVEEKKRKKKGWGIFGRKSSSKKKGKQERHA